MVLEPGPSEPEVPSKGFHPWSHRRLRQYSGQGMRDRATGATFPRRGPHQLCVPLGPSQRPRGFRALSCLLCGFCGGKIGFQTPPTSSPSGPWSRSHLFPLSLECHETCVYICVSIYMCYVSGWVEDVLCWGGWRGPDTRAPRRPCPGEVLPRGLVSGSRQGSTVSLNSPARTAPALCPAAVPPLG